MDLISPKVGVEKMLEQKPWNFITCPINYYTSDWLVFQNFSTLFEYIQLVCINNHNSITSWFFLLFRRLMDFFPTKKQTEEYLRSVFVEKGLAEVVKLHKAQASQEAKRELTQVRFSNSTSVHVVCCTLAL